MIFNIRIIEEKDYSSIADMIRNDLGYENSTDEDVRIRLAKIKEYNNYVTYVAVYEDNIIGFIGLILGTAYEFSGEYIRVAALAVKNEYQNIGVGSKLLEEAEKYAKRAKAKTMVLNSGIQRETTHRFYERRGYVKKGYSYKKSI